MIKKLDAQTLADLYEREMKQTFPRAELKPLKAMLRMQKDGKYDVLGYYDETGALLAYACICTAAVPALLDYLAVSKVHRGEGIGSRFLGALLQEREIMLEIEAVDDATDTNDRAMRARRQRFYEHLGLQRTLTEAHVFGEHYWVFSPRADSVRQVMEQIYHYMVPETDAYKKNVRIWDAE